MNSTAICALEPCPCMAPSEKLWCPRGPQYDYPVYDQDDCYKVKNVGWTLANILLHDAKTIAT